MHARSMCGGGALDSSWGLSPPLCSSPSSHLVQLLEYGFDLLLLELEAKSAHCNQHTSSSSGGSVFKTGVSRLWAAASEASGQSVRALSLSRLLLLLSPLVPSCLCVVLSCVVFVCLTGCFEFSEVDAPRSIRVEQVECLSDLLQLLVRQARATTTFLGQGLAVATGTTVRRLNNTQSSTHAQRLESAAEWGRTAPSHEPTARMCPFCDPTCDFCSMLLIDRGRSVGVVCKVNG